MYSISDLANEFSISHRTLRFYEEKGILHPKREKQNRVYSIDDRSMLKLVLRGKRLGFTLNESLSIIKLYDPVSGNKEQLVILQEKIKEKLDFLDNQKVEIDLMIKDLNEAESRCIDSMKNDK
ncbi:MerR family transcriptional regulator [Eionea flava]